MTYTPPASKLTIKEDIYEEILQVFSSQEGKTITPVLIKDIQKDITDLLGVHATYKRIDPDKWKEDNKVVVSMNDTDKRLLRLKLPKWLEEWLES